MTELAGEVADGAVLLVGLHPAAVAEARRRLEAGARRAGRSLDGFHTIFIVPIAVDDSAAQARRWVQRWFAPGQSFLTYPSASNLHWLRQAGIDLPDDHDPERIPDDQAARIADAFGLFGPPEHCLERLLARPRGGGGGARLPLPRPHPGRRLRDAHARGRRLPPRHARAALSGRAPVATAERSLDEELLWGGEHVVLPDPQAPPSPLGPGDRIVDPIVALTFLAAHTSRIPALTASSSCPSAIRWSSQRSWPRSTSCRMAGSSSASAWAISSRSSVPSAPRSRTAAASPTSTSRRSGPSAAEAAPAYRGRFAAFERVQAHPDRPEADAAHRDQRPHQGGVPARRPAGPRLVRLCPGHRRSNPLPRGPARGGGGRPAAARAAAARDQRVPARTDRPRRRQAFAALGVHRLVLIPPRSADAAGLEQFVGESDRTWSHRSYLQAPRLATRAVAEGRDDGCRRIAASRPAPGRARGSRSSSGRARGGRRRRGAPPSAPRRGRRCRRAPCPSRSGSPRLPTPADH